MVGLCHPDRDYIHILLFLGVHSLHSLRPYDVCICDAAHCCCEPSTAYVIYERINKRNVICLPAKSNKSYFHAPRNWIDSNLSIHWVDVCLVWYVLSHSVSACVCVCASEQKTDSSAINELLSSIFPYESVIWSYLLILCNKMAPLYLWDFHS